MSDLALRRRAGDLLLVPVVGIAAAATAVAGGFAPQVAIAVIAGIALLLLPLEALLVAFVGASIFSLGHGIEIASLNVLPGQLLLVPFAIRVFLLDRRSGRTRWGWPEAALLGWLALQFATSVLNAADPLRSVVAAGQLAFGGAAYLALTSAAGSRDRLVLLARAILVIAALNALLGLVAAAAHLGGIGGLDAFLAGREGSRRGDTFLPRGLVAENNLFGSFSAASAIAYLALMREANPVFSRRAATAGFAICSVAAGLSATRAAWIAFAVGLVALTMVRRPRVPRPAPASRLGLAAALVGTLLVGGMWYTSAPPGSPAQAVTELAAPISESAGRLLDFTTGTGASRVNEWRQALADLRSSPVVGLGTNSFGQRHLAQLGPHRVEPAYLGNLYVRTLHDSGVLGLLLLVAFLAGVLWLRRRLRLSAGDLAPVAHAFAVGFLVLAVAFAATDAMLLPWPWIVLGAARAASEVALRQAAGPGIASSPQARYSM